LEFALALYEDGSMMPGLEEYYEARQAELDAINTILEKLNGET